ncbi:MAG: isoprenyl transferase [Bacteroidia bacterium]
MDLRADIQPDRIPKHIAVIMDGNGRWAKKQGAMRVFGHRSAVKAVRDTTEGCAELGVKFLTLYAFSTENWNRPKLEVNALMELLVDTLAKELPILQKNKIRLNAIGNLDKLPGRCAKRLQEVIAATADNDHMTLTLALSYGARDDIKQALQRIAEDVRQDRIAPEAITDDTLGEYLSTSDMPEPELLIRTSGEHRISNFLLWEIAYSEIYFTPVLWPDFRREHLHEAIVDFQRRERRFGKISEQL